MCDPVAQSKSTRQQQAGSGGISALSDLFSWKNARMSASWFPTVSVSKFVKVLCVICMEIADTQKLLQKNKCHNQSLHSPTKKNTWLEIVVQWVCCCHVSSWCLVHGNMLVKWGNQSNDISDKPSMQHCSKRSKSLVQEKKKVIGEMSLTFLFHKFSSACSVHACPPHLIASKLSCKPWDLLWLLLLLQQLQSPRALVGNKNFCLLSFGYQLWL